MAEQNEKGEEQVVVRTRAEHYRDIYANQCALRIGAYDANLVFVHIKPALEGLMHEEQVSVTLSPQQLKSLYLAAGRILKGFEEKFGTLVLPEDLKPENEAGAATEGASASTSKRRPSRRSRAVSTH